MAVVTISLQGDTVSSSIPRFDHRLESLVSGAAGSSALSQVDLVSPIGAVLQEAIRLVMDHLHESTQESALQFRAVLEQLSAADLWDLASKRGCSVDDLAICDICDIAALAARREYEPGATWIACINANLHDIDSFVEEWLRSNYPSLHAKQMLDLAQDSEDSEILQTFCDIHSSQFHRSTDRDVVIHAIELGVLGGIEIRLRAWDGQTLLGYEVDATGVDHLGLRVRYYDLITSIVSDWQARTRKAERKRGGRKETDVEEKRRIVQGWLKVQNHRRQKAYCEEKGISVSTLQRYLRQYESGEF